MKVNLNVTGNLKEIVIASTNLNKLNEFNAVLTPKGFKLLSRLDLNFENEIEETGSTFEQNALIKAKAVFDAVGLPTIADDSGLEVDALDGKPGVFSARYASKNGKPCSNKENIAKILKEMEGQTNRTARMVCALCFINKFGKIFKIVQTCEGEIAEQPEQINGFGFDYIFLFNKQCVSTLTLEQKNKISHRGKALKVLTSNIATWWNEKP